MKLRQAAILVIAILIALLAGGAVFHPGPAGAASLTDEMRSLLQGKFAPYMSRFHEQRKLLLENLKLQKKIANRALEVLRAKDKPTRADINMAKALNRQIDKARALFAKQKKANQKLLRSIYAQVVLSLEKDGKLKKADRDAKETKDAFLKALKSELDLLAKKDKKSGLSAKAAQRSPVRRGGLAALPEPRIGPASAGPVLLRYKFKAGVTSKAKLSLTMATQLGGQSINLVMDTDMAYTIKSVDAQGNAWAVMTINRLTARVPNVQGGGNISFDSDKAADLKRKEFQSLAPLIKTPMLVKISPVGELLDEDTTALGKALGKAGAAMLGEQGASLKEQMTKSTFIQLSRKPVKMGDIYKGGTIAKVMKNGGKIVANVRYRVHAVSQDKKTVLLRPMAKFSHQAAPGSKIKMNLDRSKMKGWVLFDLERGDIRQSSAVIDMVIAAGKPGEKAMEAKVSTQLNYKTQ